MLVVPTYPHALRTYVPMCLYAFEKLRVYVPCE